MILAIETSCDETSMAIINEDKKIISHIIYSQADIFKELGGVVPEMASRLHEEKIFSVYHQTLEQANITIKDIKAIAVTYGPGLVGSLLNGVNFANSLSLIHNLPIIKVDHMEAHIMAIAIENKITFPHLSLIVSGGHTQLVLVDEELNFEVLGQTLDDAVGESYDKVSRLLELGYPGGPVIDKLASQGKVTYKLPIPMDNEEADFSFSGLKSASFNLVNQAKMKNEEINKEDFAASFQEVAITSLINKLKLA